MKKRVFCAVKLAICLTFGLMVVGCASTIKYSPELTKENAATLVINHFSSFVYEPSNTLYKDGSWLFIVNKFDGENVDWKKGRKETRVLIPQGEHVLECVIQSRTGITIVASIRINAQAGENNLGGCVYQEKIYRSIRELYSSMDEIFYFSVRFNNGLYKPTYNDTPQFYKDMQEGKSQVSLDTRSIILEPSERGRWTY